MSGYLSSQLQTPETLAAAASQHERLWNNYGDLISHIPAGPILEIGPGRGELLGLMSRRGIAGKNHDLYSVDIDSEVAEHIRETYPAVTTVHGDPIEFLQSGDRQFTGVFMLHVIEHLETDYAIRLLTNIRRHLMPEGQLVVEVPNSACTYVGNTIQSSDITHRVAYTSVSLKQLCRLAGFDSIEIAGIRPKGNSPARLIQRAAIALLITADRIKHRIFLPSWHFLHEPTIYAVCKKT